MALETAQYIDQLNIANPSGSDRLSQGDDHLRLIKQVLKNTFPNLTGPITKTQEELNAAAFVYPIGLISIWYGESANVPAGWAVCNGQTVARSDGGGNITTPDLVGKAVVGAGTLVPRGTNVGSQTASANTGTAGGHQHTISGGEHTHDVQVQSANTGGSISSTRRVVDGSGGTTAVDTVSFTAPPAHTHVATAQSSPHSHTVSEEGSHTHSVQVSTMQPSHGLHYIMKI